LTPRGKKDFAQVIANSDRGDKLKGEVNENLRPTLQEKERQMNPGGQKTA